MPLACQHCFYPLPPLTFSHVLTHTRHLFVFPLAVPQKTNLLLILGAWYELSKKISNLFNTSGSTSASAVGLKNMQDQSPPLPPLILFSFTDIHTADRNQHFYL